jgi:hypothetical protein
MVSQKVSAFVAVDNGHLHIHENNVRLLFDASVNASEVLKSFFAVPSSCYLEAKFTDGFRGDLLIDRTVLG